MSYSIHVGDSGHWDQGVNVKGQGSRVDGQGSMVEGKYHLKPFVNRLHLSSSSSPSVEFVELPVSSERACRLPSSSRAYTPSCRLSASAFSRLHSNRQRDNGRESIWFCCGSWQALDERQVSTFESLFRDRCTGTRHERVGDAERKREGEGEGEREREREQECGCLQVDACH